MITITHTDRLSRRYRQLEYGRHLQTIFPHGPGAQAFDPGGGRRLPLRGQLRHRPHHLRVRLGRAGPQLHAGRVGRDESLRPGTP